jgi:hypothetical protein
MLSVNSGKDYITAKGHHYGEWELPFWVLFDPIRSTIHLGIANE